MGVGVEVGVGAQKVVDIGPKCIGVEGGGGVGGRKLLILGQTAWGLWWGGGGGGRGEGGSRKLLI